METVLSCICRSAKLCKRTCHRPFSFRCLHLIKTATIWMLRGVCVLFCLTSHGKHTQGNITPNTMKALRYTSCFFFWSNNRSLHSLWGPPLFLFTHLFVVFTQMWPDSRQRDKKENASSIFFCVLFLAVNNSHRLSVSHADVNQQRNQTKPWKCVILQVELTCWRC